MKIINCEIFREFISDDLESRIMKNPNKHRGANHENDTKWSLGDPVPFFTPLVR
jgi:hypothetical protein